MTEYDLVIDGSNLMLYGLTEKNQETYVVDLEKFRDKLDYFRKSGYWSLLCFDVSTLDKIQKGKIKINGEVKQLERILEDHNAQFIQSDYEMAEHAIQFGCPVVTNDKFRKWCNGQEKNKRSKISLEEWAVIQRQSIRHKSSKNGRFTAVPPLQNKTSMFNIKSRSDQMARELLELKSQNESLKRQKELQRATIASLRKSRNVG
ncbi:MAG: hypothetical protein CMB74_07280 [Euryarchaeota archaeon]|nr:hypothetical protein [Euryarchaeota archaeon]|tara:strand:+ start:4481 stop:5092 length:612 start_codon:yes stop_codon:yes gene_type:complete